MQRHMMKSKIHRATVTEACLNYEGSLTVDQDLMDAATMIPYEMINVYNVNSGDRFETYLLPGPRGRGDICLNGAAARKGQVGDKIIIVTSCMLNEAELASHEPVVVLVEDQNRIKKESHSEQAFLKLAP
jgi:aspartate 1-decarboxylase